MTYFDDALPAFAAIIANEWGLRALEENFFLRDSDGRLTLIVKNESFALDERQALVKKTVALLPYVDVAGFAIATADELFDERLKSWSGVAKVPVHSSVFNGYVFVLDRRIVGADWLGKLSETARAPRRLAFSSIKGGVGRSTALCVLAAHLAASGKRVLAVDLDLEAPGLGNMLLPADTLPEFGLLDYLVEQPLGQLEDQFYVDLVASSWVGGGLGRVDVLPALGQRSLRNPANVLAKLARAYLSNSTTNGLSFTDRINMLLAKLATPQKYDAVLIDARAGLHETTASAIIGLGAHVLFFGVDQSQTYAGYELLLAHLGGVPSPNEDERWSSRITFVQAKSDLQDTGEFERQCKSLFRKYVINAFAAVNDADAERLAMLESLKDNYVVDWVSPDVLENDVDSLLDDESLSVVSIFSSEMYLKFDPLTKPAQLDSQLFSLAYGDFLSAARVALKLDGELIE